MSTTARKIRKREHHLALESGAAVFAIHTRTPKGRTHPDVRAARARIDGTAYAHAPKVGTPILDRASFYELSERRQIRELEARGKWPKSKRAQEMTLGKLAARRPDRKAEPTRIRGRR